MFGMIKKKFIALFFCIVNSFNHTKCVSLSNQKCEIQLLFINLRPNEYSQEFHYYPFTFKLYKYVHYYPFTVKLDKCVGSCNTRNDLINKVYVPNRTQDSNLSVFNMITGINESKILTRHISCKWKWKFDETTCNPIQWLDNYKYRCECKKHIRKEDCVRNPSICICENGKYLASIMDDSAIICDQIIYAAEPNFIEKDITCKTQNFYVLLAFLLITIAFLIAVSIYCDLIKY